MDTLIGCELVSKISFQKSKTWGVPVYWVQMLISRGVSVCVEKRNECNICLGDKSLVGKCRGESLEDLRAWRDCHISSQIIMVNLLLHDVNGKRKAFPCIPSRLIKR